MSNLDGRIRKLENHTGIRSQPVTLVVVAGETEADTEADQQKAIADYHAMNPDKADAEFNIIHVVTEYGRRLTERIIAGEGTE